MSKELPFPLITIKLWIWVKNLKISMTTSALMHEFDGIWLELSSNRDEKYFRINSAAPIELCIVASSFTASLFKLVLFPEWSNLTWQYSWKVLSANSSAPSSSSVLKAQSFQLLMDSCSCSIPFQVKIFVCENSDSLIKICFFVFSLVLISCRICLIKVLYSEIFNFNLVPDNLGFSHLL